MRGKNRKVSVIICWVLSLLLCLAALKARCFHDRSLELMQEAVFGMHPEQIEAAFSSPWEPDVVKEVFFLED